MQSRGRAQQRDTVAVSDRLFGSITVFTGTTWDTDLHGQVDLCVGIRCRCQSCRQWVQHDISIAVVAILHQGVKEQPISPPTCRDTAS